MSTVTRYVRVVGLVQGVGFRPTVYRIAKDLCLKGEVFNDAQGVGIYLQGDETAVNRFAGQLLENKPPLARIDEISQTTCEARSYDDFTITESQAGRVTTNITADAATCEHCLADMFDPANRRWRYAFTNCTHCGPRFTITRGLPYDRPQTSMASFVMCPPCQEEYHAPLDRRFHAQPNACPDCGPTLWFAQADRVPVPGDAVDSTVEALRAGKIVAVKGLGGFHLVCDAQNAAAVARLRQRKHRDEKPLAVMVANLKSAERWVELDDVSRSLLSGTQRPIVLAPKKEDDCLPGIADGMRDLGVMLPYTPVHWLLFHSWIGKPWGTEWTKSEAIDVALVMTSANPGGEPLVIDNDEAYERLATIADAWLLHNREIVIRCDDSVVRPVADKTVFIRRSRGYVPEGIRIDREMPTVLATGAYLKNVAALSRGKEIFLTQHIGDLDNRSTCSALEDAIKHLEDVLQITPDVLTSDCHPDFYSTRLAVSLAQERNVPYVPIYHHAAHVGAVMGEYGRTQTTLGLALDGVGLGPDGNVWGGELLRVDTHGFDWVGGMRPLPLPGGDRAAKEPRRMAAAVLTLLGREDEIERRWTPLPNAAQFGSLVRNTRLTKSGSALGRWFDAASALLGLCDIQRDEAQAAMRLESVATRAQGVVKDGLWRIENGRLDLLPLMEYLADAGVEQRAQAAADFHRTLARGLAEMTRQAADRIGYEGPLALSGGCIANRLLTRALRFDLIERGFDVLIPNTVPPGDAGIAFGQAWLAGLAVKQGWSSHVWRGQK